MTIDSAIIREYYEADQAFLLKRAELLSRDELVSLPQDVREARASLECRDELERRTAALIAYEAAKRELEDRMVRAHEVLGAMRMLGQETQ